MRINARLDEAHAEKLDYLETVTGTTATEVIKRALDLYYDQVSHEAAARPGDVLAATDFIGCAEGDADLSKDDKRQLTEDWSAKHDHR